MQKKTIAMCQNGQSCQEICNCNNFHLVTIKCTQILTEIGVCHISTVIWNIFTARLCATEHKSFQEPETFSVGHLKKKLLDLYEMS